MPAATAIELVHMATLVHDDVLDGAPVRRGRPTVVARSGRDAAVSVGDLLFSRAFAELATAERGQTQVAELSSASVGLAHGELAQRRDSYDTGVTEERYLERCSLKTARLFEAACRIGRLAAGGEGTDELGALRSRDRPRLPASRRRARRQRPSRANRQGPRDRPARRDGQPAADRGDEARPRLASLDLRSLDEAEAERVCDRITATGALDEVRDRARAGIERAKRGLDSDPFSDTDRRLLGLIADGVVERYS